MEFSPRYHFRDWPNPEVPNVAAGVYAIWNDSEFFYCGMSGRAIEDARKRGRQKYGLVTRLSSHASGRLSGDQFCVYVANRLVLPSLDPSELSRFESGELTLDQLTKSYIHDHLEYQYKLVDSSKDAYEIEAKGRAGDIFGVKPRLNPL